MSIKDIYPLRQGELIAKDAHDLIVQASLRRQKIIEDAEIRYWQQILSITNDKLCAFYVSEWYEALADDEEHAYEEFIENLFSDIDKVLFN